MRIVVLTNEYEPNVLGGLGIVATRLAEELAMRHHDVVVLTKGRARQVEDRLHQGVRVIRFPRESEYHSRASQRLYAPPILHYLRKRMPAPDIVHNHSIQADELQEAMRDAYGALAIYTCHSLVSEEGLHSAHSIRMAGRQHNMLQRADAVVSPSRWQASLISRHFPKVVSKTYVISNGIDIDRIEQTRRKTHLLFVGRLIRAKGIEDLIRAIAILQKKEPQVKLDVIGQGDAAYIAYLRRLARSKRIAHAVRFLGHSQHGHVLRAMRTYGGVVVPSRNESFGLVALEAMAVGCPLISTRACGLQEFVDEDVASIIEKVSANDIANAISLMWKNQDTTESRRTSAYHRAQEYTWPHVAEMYEKVMQSKGKPYSFPNLRV